MAPTHLCLTVLTSTTLLLAGGEPVTTQPVGYEQAFRDLYEHLGRCYPAFQLKGINWKQVGDELLPKVREVKTDEQFGLLCMQLVARLEDSHARLLPGSARPPEPPLPAWSPGLGCLIDDRDQPVVFYVDPAGPAARAGIRPGLTVSSVASRPAEAALRGCMRLYAAYFGYSSERCLRHDAARFFLHCLGPGEMLRLELSDLDGTRRAYELPAMLSSLSFPRLPVPIEGIRDGADVAWKRLPDDIGYLRLRRIRGDLPGDLDKAVAGLQGTRGLIIDLRGNGGGGFDAKRAFRNFNTEDGLEPLRPRYVGPIALLTDERCISAGEGWASWFVATRRARVFGAATAGASSRKETYTLTNGLFQVVVPVRLYRGSLDRPIERRGLEPDVPVRQKAADLAVGRDTVLETARQYLLTATSKRRPTSDEPSP